MLPYTCSVLGCAQDEMYVQLHNKICGVVAQVSGNSVEVVVARCICSRGLSAALLTSEF